MIGDERHELTYVIHHPDEIVAMMHEAGFIDVRVVGGYDGATPSPDHQFLVYEGRNPGGPIASARRRGARTVSTVSR